MQNSELPWMMLGFVDGTAFLITLIILMAWATMWVLVRGL